MPEIDLERAQREEARWRILRVLDAGRPLPVTESIIWRTLSDLGLGLTPHGLRRELDYLAERDLVRLSGTDTLIWSAVLTHYGIDVVEYTIDCHPGIARPPRS